MLKTGTTLSDRYEIVSALGAGGMGEVYRARDLRLGRDVAVKVLPENLASNPAALSRFEREAKALAALSHNNILAIFDFGKHNGNSFAVMELLEGETLRTQLGSSRPTRKRILEIAAAIADGLGAAHSAGVIHRDLKPENVFLTSDGTVKILDFGLARIDPVTPGTQTAVQTISQTGAGVVMGTAPYMSPEQIRGVSADARTDIFSFGCVLYEMLAGTRAFSGNNATETMASILRDEPSGLDGSRGILPSDLIPLISRCLQKNPEHRFQSSRDLAYDLRNFLSGTAQPQAPPTKPSIRLRRSIWIPVTLVAWILAATSVYYFFFHGKAIHSIAVLPFTNASSGPDAEYLSDGITDSIINRLSQLPGIRVIAPDTVFTYKNKVMDPRIIAHDLNVEAVVAGRVVQQGQTLIIRASLISAKDGAQLWGDQYDRRLSDALQIQEEISQEIFHKLQLRLSGVEKERAEKHYTQNNEAYQLYLKGRYHWYRFTPEDYEKSVEYYKQAIQKDPRYALAYIGLTDSYVAMTFEGILPPREGLSKARKVIKTAREIDSTLVDSVRASFENVWNAALTIEQEKKTLSLNPNNVPARRFLSQVLLCVGRKDDAIAEMKLALEIDPLSLVTNKSLGARYLWTQQYDKAIDQLNKTVDLDPKYPDAHDLLADAYARKGMAKESIAERQTFLRLVGDDDGADTLGKDYAASGYDEAMRNLYNRTLEAYQQVAEEQYVSPVAFAELYSLLNQKDDAFLWLEKAFAEGAPWLVYLPADPVFDNLRSDPRFNNLVRRVASAS